jgi:hypothetical protein
VPALNGATISTLTNGLGQPVFVIYEFFDPATGNLRDVTQDTSTGPRTGALIVDNMTGTPQAVVVALPPKVPKTFTVPVDGVAFTVAQLAANRNSNGGPITTYADLAGISPSLT